jgi:chromosome condensin MukBEF MukE localization factor
LDKKLFDMLANFENIETELYFKLEKELGGDRAEELLNDLVDYRESLLKIGRHIDEENLSDKEGFLMKDFEDFQRYTRVIVFYEYDNGFTLGETTSGLFMLVPSELISFEKA